MTGPSQNFNGGNPQYQYQQPQPVRPLNVADSIYSTTLNPKSGGRDIFSALTHVIKGGNPAGLAVAAGPEKDNGEDTYTGRFLDGFIKGYLKKVTLTAGEKTCLRERIKKSGKHGIRILEVLLKILGEFIGHTNNSPAMMMEGMSGVSEIMTIVRQAKAIQQGCIKADAMAVWKVSLRNMRNISYIQSRVTANSLDILKVLADAVPRVEKGQYTKVGADIGKLVRQVILSRDSSPRPMLIPQGMRKEQIGEIIMVNAIRGMFLPGSNVTIKSSVDPAVNVFIDLHRCIGKEAKYFAQAFDAFFKAATQLGAGVQNLEAKMGIPVAGQPKVDYSASQDPMGWISKLSGVMFNVPTLMNRCGLTTEQRQMLKRLLQEMQTMEMTFRVPGETNRTKASMKASGKFEKATEDWDAGRYDAFGMHLGGVIRDLLLAFKRRKNKPLPPLPMGMEAQRRLGKEQNMDRTGAGALPLGIGMFGIISMLGFSLFRIVQSRNTSRTGILLRAEDVEARIHEVE
jgi:hypothetical protein